MEGFELLSTGAWSILPPLLALGLALITKEVCPISSQSRIASFSM